MSLVLVVEDERSIRQAIRFELLDDGYDVHCAESYQEAATYIKAFHYDLVISDIFLQDGVGTRLIALAQKTKKQVPFIFISAFPESDLAIRVKKALKDRFFEKPFFPNALKEKAYEILTNNLSDGINLPRPTFCPKN
jgi:DNA-binding response OmpR family regulator